MLHGMDAPVAPSGGRVCGSAIKLSKKQSRLDWDWDWDQPVAPSASTPSPGTSLSPGSGARACQGRG